MKVLTDGWGTAPNGNPLNLYTISSPSGITASWTDWGATLVSLKVPGKTRQAEEVLLTFDTPGDFLTKGRFFGAVVGRWANRIAGGQFTLEGQTFHLPVNIPPHHLHGGRESYCARVWAGEPFEAPGRSGVLFRLTDPAGTMGYPGTLEAEAEYWLTDGGELGWELRARTDAPTIVNLVNHAYWNLGGMESESILDHRLTLPSRFYYPGDETSLPEQKFLPVSGTAFDFRRGKSLGTDIKETGNGYDHCYVVEKEPGNPLGLAAVLEDSSSGRRMEVYTESPCLQLYTGNFLGGDPGAGGRRHQKYSGVCLETQFLPDAPNRSSLPPGHPSPALFPGILWSYRTIHRFSW